CGCDAQPCSGRLFDQFGRCVCLPAVHTRPGNHHDWCCRAELRLQRQCGVRDVLDTTSSIAYEPNDLNRDRVAETRMVPGAITDHAAHIQQVKAIPSFDCFGDVADETLQRASASKHANKQVAGINFGESPAWQLKHVVSCTIRQRTHYDHITGARVIRIADKRNGSPKRERRSCRTNLVDFDVITFFVHDEPPLEPAAFDPPLNRSRRAFSLIKPSASRWL